MQMGSTLMRIGILGTPTTSGNRGVQALSESLCRLCLQSHSNVELKIYDSGSENHVYIRPTGSSLRIKKVNWRLSPKSRFSQNLIVILFFSVLYRILSFRSFRCWISNTIPWIRELENTDLVGDVRGGDSFSDIYGLKRYLIATLPVVSVIAVKNSIVLFPQTYGPYKNWLSRVIAKWIIRHSHTIIARDEHSRAAALAFTRKDQSVILSPDVAFCLQAIPSEHLAIDPPIEPEKPKVVIGLNINGLMYNGGYNGKNMFGLKLDYKDYIKKLLTNLLSDQEIHVLIVPHTIAPKGDVESDNGASYEMRDTLDDQLKDRVHIVANTDLDAHEIKSVISGCNAFVGSRMHSCIAALSQGVPCVGVAYSMKFLGVFESVGMGNWVVDAKEFDTRSAVTQTLKLLEGFEDNKQKLVTESYEAQSRLREVFRDLVSSGSKTTCPETNGHSIQ